MSITFMPMIHDRATNSWHLPDAVRIDPGRFERNVSNANGQWTCCWRSASRPTPCADPSDRCLRPPRDGRPAPPSRPSLARNGDDDRRRTRPHDLDLLRPPRRIPRRPAGRPCAPDPAQPRPPAPRMSAGADAPRHRASCKPPSDTHHRQGDRHEPQDHPRARARHDRRGRLGQPARHFLRPGHPRARQSRTTPTRSCSGPEGKFGEVQRAEDLVAPLAPYAALTPETIEQLRADRAACADRGPSTLQREMLRRIGRRS